MSKYYRSSPMSKILPPSIETGGIWDYIAEQTTPHPHTDEESQIPMERQQVIKYYEDQRKYMKIFLYILGGLAIVVLYMLFKK